MMCKEVRESIKQLFYTVVLEKEKVEEIRTKIKKYCGFHHDIELRHEISHKDNVNYNYYKTFISKFYMSNDEFLNEFFSRLKRKFTGNHILSLFPSPIKNYCFELNCEKASNQHLLKLIVKEIKDQEVIFNYEYTFNKKIIHNHISFSRETLERRTREKFSTRVEKSELITFLLGMKICDEKTIQDIYSKCGYQYPKELQYANDLLDITFLIFQDKAKKIYEEDIVFYASRNPSKLSETELNQTEYTRHIYYNSDDNVLNFITLFQYIVLKRSIHIFDYIESEKNKVQNRSKNKKEKELLKELHLPPYTMKLIHFYIEWWKNQEEFYREIVSLFEKSSYDNENEYRYQEIRYEQVVMFFFLCYFFMSYETIKSKDMFRYMDTLIRNNEIVQAMMYINIGLIGLDDSFSRYQNSLLLPSYDKMKKVYHILFTKDFVKSAHFRKLMKMIYRYIEDEPYHQEKIIEKMNEVYQLLSQFINHITKINE